jgi:predicted NBD/HSP70 family sugar kinase
VNETKVNVKVTTIAEMAERIAGPGAPVGGTSQKEVLRQIAQDAGTVTRGMIAARSELSTATVSKAVAHLLELRLVDDGARGRRRPGAALGWTNDYIQVGVMISARGGYATELIGTVTKLDGTPLPSFKTPRSADGWEDWALWPITDRTQKGVLKQLCDFVQALLRRAAADAPTAEVLGCGVSVGGHVDTSGTLRKSFNTGWDDDFKLEGDLAEELKMAGLELDVVLENDVTSHAIHSNLTSRPADSYALVAVLCDAVGGGIVVDGKTRRGDHGLAGEIGHIYVGSEDSVVSSDDSSLFRGTKPLCPCGNVGCLQAFATPEAIFKTARSVEEAFEERDFMELASQPHTDTKVRNAFRQGGTALGRGLASLIYLFDPRMIFLYLPPALLIDNKFLTGYAYMEAIRSELGRYVYIGDSPDLDLGVLLHPEPKTEDELKELGAKAAATVVLGRLISAVGASHLTERRAHAGGL